MLCNSFTLGSRQSSWPRNFSAFFFSTQASAAGQFMPWPLSACDQTLATLKETNRYPATNGDQGPRAGFARVGANEWEPFRKQFR